METLAKIAIGALVSVNAWFLRGVAADLKESTRMLHNHETRITVLERADK